MSRSHEPGADEAPGREVDELTSTGPDSLQQAAERRRRFAELTFEKRELAAEAKSKGRELDELEPKVLDDYAELGTDSMRADLGERKATVHLAPDFHARPHKSGVDDKGDPTATDEDWQRACDALRAAGLGQYVVERFNVQSLASWLRGFRDEHGPEWREHLPDELVDALELGMKMRVRVRKA